MYTPKMTVFEKKQIQKINGQSFTEAPVSPGPRVSSILSTALTAIDIECSLLNGIFFIFIKSEQIIYKN